MEVLKKFTGTWSGSYGYDPAENMPVRDSTPFTLRLKHGWFGRFKGVVNESGPNAMPETGAIRGRLSFPFLEFTKIMPIAYLSLSDGTVVSWPEYLRLRNLDGDPKLPHPPIIYKGVFLDTSRAEGVWIIMPGRIPLRDGRALRRIGASGKWEIKRETD